MLTATSYWYHTVRSNKKVYTAFLLLILVPCTASASQLKELLFQAIDNGTANGIITDQMADEIHKQTGTTKPIYVDVTTLKILEQAGCRRLNAKFTMPGVSMTLLSGKKEPFEMNMGINLCRDGTPPAENAR